MNSFTPVTLITGASSGIGAALAREYAQSGHNLALGARRVDRLEQLRSEILHEHPHLAVHIQKCDVTSKEDVIHFVNESQQKLGRLDIVIANAGFPVAEPIAHLQVEDYKRQFDTNVFAVVQTFYASFNFIKETQGRFVIIGSVAGHMTPPGSVPYSMSKFAVRAFAYGLQQEFHSSGVSMTLISPGYVESEIAKIDRFGRYIESREGIAPPWLKMDTHLAARQIVKAVARRQNEKILTWHGLFVVWMQRVAPTLLRWILGHLRMRSV